MALNAMDFRYIKVKPTCLDSKCNTNEQNVCKISPSEYFCDLFGENKSVPNPDWRQLCNITFTQR